MSHFVDLPWISLSASLEDKEQIHVAAWNILSGFFQNASVHNWPSTKQLFSNSDVACQAQT